MRSTLFLLALLALASPSFAQSDKALFIDQDGSVGIGAPASSYLFGIDMSRKFAALRLNTIRVSAGDFVYASFIGFDITNDVVMVPNVQIGTIGNVNHGGTPALTRFYIGLNGANYSTATHFVMVPDGSGGARVGIGTMSPTQRLHVNGNVLANAFQQPSSQRWKTDIQPIEGASNLVARLRGVQFSWRETGRRDIGLIAEEVSAVVPEVVTFSADSANAESVDYARLVAVLKRSRKKERGRTRWKNVWRRWKPSCKREASSLLRPCALLHEAENNGFDLIYHHAYLPTTSPCRLVRMLSLCKGNHRSKHAVQRLLHI